MSKYLVFNKLMAEGEWEDFLQFSAYMFLKKSYSIYNSALILIQRPGALNLETEQKWNQMGRFLRPEAQPILVLQPFAPINFLYEYSDTEGTTELNLPNYKEIHLPKSPINPQIYERLLRLMYNLAIYHGERNLGTIEWGFTELTHHQRPFTYETKSKKGVKIETVYSRTVIVINSRLSLVDKVRTIFHELGHILCGHMEKDKNNSKLKVVSRVGEELTKEQKEFEAEKFCEILCNIISIQYQGENYLQGYLVNGQPPNINLQAVIQAVDKMIIAYKKTFTAKNNNEQLTLF